MKSVLLIASLLLIGCGSTTQSYDITEHNITVDEPYEIPGGLAIIVDNSDEAVVTVDATTITIDCGGSCGDISIGSEVL